MKQWVSSRSKLGLPVDNVDDFIWYVTIPEASQQWLLQDYAQKHPFSAVFIVFTPTDAPGEPIGYVTWETLVKAQGRIDRSILSRVEGILVFPWENVGIATRISQSRLEPLNMLQVVEDDRLDDDNFKEHGVANAIVDYLNHLYDNSYTKTDVSYERGFITYLQSLSEIELIRYLVNNGYREDIQTKRMWSNATVEDVQQFMIRFNVSIADGPDAVPKVMFHVPYEQFPVPPVYPGGFARITWKDMPQWIWEREENLSKHEIPKKIYKNVKEECKGDPKRFQEGRFKHHVYKRQQRRKTGEINNDDYVGVTMDIEDLVMKASPACLRNTLKKQKWYKDGERYQIVSQLCSAKIDHDVIRSIFDESMKHNDDPRHKAWDVEAALKKTYVGATCDSIREHGENTEDILACPFAEKQECLTEFNERYPEKMRTQDVMKYPFQYILRYNYRK